MRLYPRHAELALHLVWILFSGAAIALFYALARRLTLPHPLLWTAVFCLGPAFLPAQNLMVDVPLTALWLAFFHALVRPGSERPDRRPLLAALVAGFACLVKYTSLVLLPVLAAVVAGEPDQRLRQRVVGQAPLRRGVAVALAAARVERGVGLRRHGRG